MRPLSAAELLSVWERVIGIPPLQQALAWLAAVYPDRAPEALTHLSLGTLSAHLLALRERLFGAQLHSLTVCPQCAEHIELSFSVQDICPMSVAQTLDAERSQPLELTAEGYTVQFRLPNSADLT